jgi:hypothetical protein
MFLLMAEERVATATALLSTVVLGVLKLGLSLKSMKRILTNYDTVYLSNG